MTTPYTQRFYDNIASGSRRSAEVILPWLITRIKPASLVDVGCGIATWTATAKANGVERVLGIDGDYVDRDALQISAAEFLSHDLATPLPDVGRFDLAISLEVAEHLPADRSDGFVADLARLAPAVMFSAAAPGQGGNDHVNEQWPSYWGQRFADHGFIALDAIRTRFWDDDAVEPWYRQNAVLFVERDMAFDVASAFDHQTIPGIRLPAFERPVPAGISDSARDLVAAVRRSITHRLNR